MSTTRELYTTPKAIAEFAISPVGGECPSRPCRYWPALFRESDGMRKGWSTARGPYVLININRLFRRKLVFSTVDSA